MIDRLDSIVNILYRFKIIIKTSFSKLEFDTYFVRYFYSKYIYMCIYYISVLEFSKRTLAFPGRVCFRLKTVFSNIVDFESYSS